MGKSLKIAVIHGAFNSSGASERLVLEQAKGLRQLGHQVECYALTLDRQACFPELVEELGVKTLLPQLPNWVPLRDAIAVALGSLLAPVLAAGFREVELLVGVDQPGVWIAYRMSKVLRMPYVIYLNHPNRLVHPRRVDQEFGWLAARGFQAFHFLVKRIKPLLARADRVSVAGAELALANGGYIQRVLEKLHRREFVLCPAGCHPQPRRLLRLEPLTPYEGAFKLGGQIIDRPFVLVTNRHQPHNKVENVIEAVAPIAALVPSLTLVIPGPFTSHTPRLLALAKGLGLQQRVQFLGQVSESDLQRLYREAAVYCTPAPEEAFGMGVIEAMAWGVPVVAWNNAGPMVTVLDGKTGFLVEPFNVVAYAEALALLLEDRELRSRMGAAGRERVEHYFSWDRHVRLLDRAVRRATGEEIEISVPVSVPLRRQMGAGPLHLPASAEVAELETGPPVGG